MLAQFMLFLSCIQLVSSQSSDTALVNIGSGFSSTKELYSFNFNLVSQKPDELSIPVFLTDVSISTGNSVTVTCGLTIGSLPGYSNADFGQAVVPVSTSSGKVTFSSPIVGRVTAIQCWIINLKSDSISSPKGFVITPGGTVNLVFPVTVVGSPFWLKLSVPAEGSDVDVTCISSALNQSSLTFKFAIGQQIQSFSVNYPAVANSSTVQCSGKSKSGSQFIPQSSSGVVGIIVPFVPQAKLVPVLSQVISQSSNPQIQEFLVINEISDGSVRFTCSLYTLSSVSSTGGVSPTTSSVTGQWTLCTGLSQCGTYTIEGGQTFTTVQLIRTSGVTEYTKELVNVVCLGLAGVYANQTPSFLASVELYPSSTNDGISGNSNYTLTSVNPAYVNIAPCPCNLLPNVCDENCCCDTSCTPSDISSFSCYQGFFGGLNNFTSNEFCNSTYFYKPEWFPIMCITTESNGFLGYFYYLPVTQPLSTDSTVVVVSSYSTPYSYSAKQSVAPTETGYKQGVALMTGLQTSTPVDQVQRSGTNYRLTLPMESLNGQCTSFAPVQFLNDSLSTCNVQVTADICRTNPQLSALTYAQSLTWGNSTGPLLLREQTSNYVADANVNYLCSTGDSAYVKSSKTYAEAVPANSTSCFDSTGGCSVIGSCGVDGSTGVYACPNDSISWVTASPMEPRCSFDNGFQVPPAPSYNITGQMCNNVVVRVLYNITWSGQSIVRLNASVTLAPISLASRVAILTQEFQVVYHALPVSVNSSDSSDAYYPPSGNPGYDKLLPVISGILVNGSHIDANSNNRLSLFKPDGTGLCSTSSREDIQFVVNELSSCQMRLNYNTLQNCSNIRKLVLNALNSLMPSTYISIIGNPVLDNLTDWVGIIRQDLSSVLNSSSSTASSTTAYNAAATSSALNSTYPYLPNLAGVCYNVPSGISIDILYVQAGLSNYQPIYNIVGARISYNLSTWHVQCTGSGSVSCTDFSAVQSFTVTSSANFVQVPPVPPPPQTVYDAPIYALPYVCPQDACWSQFFYPFSKLNPGESQQQTLAVALAFIVLLIFFYAITRPVSFFSSVL